MVLAGELTHGDLTHAAQMDYLLFYPLREKLGDIKPKEVKEIITSYGKGIVHGTKGYKDAWNALFDQTGNGTTLRTPNVFYSVFGRDLNL